MSQSDPPASVLGVSLANWIPEKRLNQSEKHPDLRVHPAGQGIAIEPGARDDAIREAIEGLETRADTHSRNVRYQQAAYFNRLAYALMHDEPQVHVRIERIGGPTPMAILTVTRQLYPIGHLANDEPPDLALFEPPA